LLFAVVAASKAAMGITHLTQRDGDLAAHLAVGNYILATGSIPPHSLSSYTVAGEPFVAHAWLSALLFSILYKLGGLVLVGVVAAITIAATHALILDFLRKRDLDPRWALAAALMSLAVASSHWLARPHMFSILGATLTLLLLESRTRRTLLLGAALFLLWANLHGGWAFGLVLIAAYALGELLEWKLHGDLDAKARLSAHLKLLLVCGAVTLLNPYGPRLHIEILEAATSPLLAASISEYLSPNFQALAALPFLLSVLATMGILAMSRHRMPWSWAITLFVTLFFALRAVRAIPMFAVAAWPLVAVHAARSFGNAWNVRLFGEFARLDRTGTTRAWILATAGLLLAFGVNRGSVLGNTIVSDRFDRSIFPLAAAGNARAAGIGQRVFAPWAWGGFFTLAWPEAKHHVDPLKFNRTTIASYARIEGVLPGWREALDEWQVDAVVEPPDSPLATALADEPGWQRWFSDATASLYRRVDGAPGADETDP
jgi:hypothetical protein